MFSNSAISPLIHRALALARSLDEEHPSRVLEAGLQPILEPAGWTWFQAAMDAATGGPGLLDTVDDIVDTLPAEARRTGGIFPTPSPIADQMAGLVEIDPGSAATVIDLSAGTGALLRAVIRRHPSVTTVGVEKEPVLAVAAALGVWESRVAAGDFEIIRDRIYVGDGLASPWAWSEEALPPVAAVIGNPPYVGEKGNRAIFEELRASHPHLEEYFAARMDLLYLFFHRGLDALPAGGRLVYLTSEYWMTATGATRLRRDLLERGVPRRFLRFEGTGLFADAPGHHSLIAVIDRFEADHAPRPGCLATIAGSATSRPVPGELLSESRWTPFVETTTAAWHQDRAELCSPLQALAGDCQGFVSGADRLSGRHFKWLDGGNDAAHEPGAPIFLVDPDELTPFLKSVSAWTLRPVFRGSSILKNQIYYEAPRDLFVLYLDGEVTPSQEEYLLEHLGPFKAVLERRREVQNGRMPWYRLHWPRRRREQAGPKLVVPRRASEPTFCLDLSGAAISSDCTYLVAPRNARSPVRYLTALMLLLNSDDTCRYLKAFGKTKGDLLEFYSDPLRSLPIAAQNIDGELYLVEALWEEEAAEKFWEEVDRRLNAQI
ncbi:MAG: Eco57I restriction-modification methylase domain-containing protein [Bradymonadaceae bacterium]